MKRKVKIGIDLGGSHVGVGVVDTKGNIIEIHEKDLEDSINNFLNNLDDDKEIIDIDWVWANE